MEGLTPRQAGREGSQRQKRGTEVFPLESARRKPALALHSRSKSAREIGKDFNSDP